MAKIERKPAMNVARNEVMAKCSTSLFEVRASNTIAASRTSSVQLNQLPVWVIFGLPKNARNLTSTMDHGACKHSISPFTFYWIEFAEIVA